MLFLQSVKNAYLKMPDWIKAPIETIPPSVVLGKNYRAQKYLLKESRNWSAQELIEYQRSKLFDVAEYAAKYVPYYREMFSLMGLPERLTSIEQYQSLPLLTKDIIREQGDRLVSEKVKKSARYKVMTGGTSGTPLEFWMSSEAYAKEWAFVHDLLERYNIESTDRKIGLRGVAFPKASEGVYHQFNTIYRELQISPFHLTESNLGNLEKIIKNYRIKYIHGYPSSVTQFVSLISKYDWCKDLQLKGVLLVSETVYPYQKKMIENALKCPVISFYGHSERLAFAGTVPGEEDYFLDPRYGFSEIHEGELVSTGFINMATPMLRYRTGDMARIDADGSPNRLGTNAFPKLKGVKGRWLQEMLFGKSGAKISITSLNMHSDVFKKVQRFQFYQDKPGMFELRVVPTSDFQKETDYGRIEKAFMEKVGHELDFIIKTVDKVDYTSRGKQKFLIQKLRTEDHLAS